MVRADHALDFDGSPSWERLIVEFGSAGDAAHDAAQRWYEPEDG